MQTWHGTVCGWATNLVPSYESSWLVMDDRVLGGRIFRLREDFQVLKSEGIQITTLRMREYVYLCDWEHVHGRLSSRAGKQSESHRPISGRVSSLSSSRSMQGVLCTDIEIDSRVPGSEYSRASPEVSCHSFGLLRSHHPW